MPEAFRLVVALLNLPEPVLELSIVRLQSEEPSAFRNDRDADPVAGRSVFDGVADEVLHRPGERHGITSDRGQVLRDLAFHRKTAFTNGHIQSVDRPFRQFAGPAYPTPATPEVQKTNPCGA